jgi:hypothetical protein
MPNIVLKKQVSQITAAALALWGLISLFGRLIDLAGPDLFWEVFTGAKSFNKILFIPIPNDIEDLLFYTGFQSVNLISLLTVGLIGTAVAFLLSNDRKFLLILMGVAAFHVFTSFQLLIDYGFNSNIREYLGLFTIIRWTILGAVVPLLGGLALASVLFGEKVPAVEDFFTKTSPLNIPDFSINGPQSQQGFNAQSSHSSFNPGGNMTNENSQAGNNPGFNQAGNNPGNNFPPPSANFGGNTGSSPWDLTTPLYLVQMMGTGDRLYSIGELQQMAKQKALKGNTMVQHRDAGYPVQASTVPNVFSDKQWITVLLLSFFLGGLGVDRFYLGHTGVGIAKLLTFGGCGVWALIDFILIAMRNINDSDGRPLA